MPKRMTWSSGAMTKQAKPAEIIYLANPRGFCAGVDRAIAIVNQVLANHGAPIYVKHEIVHNRTIVEEFKQKGVVFIEDPQQVPEKAILVYSAHGVSEAVRRAAVARQLTIYDATCPLVTKVHAEVKRLRANGYEIIMIGHAGHPEVEGTLGQAAEGIYLIECTDDVKKLTVHNEEKIAYVTQTTLSVDDTADIIRALTARFPKINIPQKDDICYATQNRQDAVKAMAATCEMILVVGSPTSSNSNRLCEVARQRGASAYLVDTAADIQPQWLEGVRSIGVTAGASAPEQLVQDLITALRVAAPQVAIKSLDGVEENIVFSMPKHLARSAQNSR